MSKRRVEIRIAGTVHSGKTSFAILIRDFLEDMLGLEVDIEGSDDTEEALAEKSRRLHTAPGRLEFLENLASKGVKVRIIEGIQLSVPANEVTSNEPQ